MKVALFGGTFDPFHRAHKDIVKAACDLDYLDKIVVMPAGIPPHKQDQWISFASYRLRMTELAMKNMDKVKVSRYEVKRKGVSYTNKTLKHLKKKYDTKDLYLIIGADSFLQIENWHKFKKILKKATLLVAARPGVKNLKKHKEYLEDEYNAEIEFLDLDKSDVSSSELRKELSKGDYSTEDLDLSVRKYIKNNKIYRKKDLRKYFNEEQIANLREYERRLFPLLSTYRVSHCVNVMYRAIKIAKKMGYNNFYKAAVAGLLHDCAKEIDVDEYLDFKETTDKSYIDTDKLTHGPLGAYILEPMFGITDREIYNAIYYHTTLRPNFTDLDVIVYLADKTEPGRKYHGVGKIRKLIKAGKIKEALLLSLDTNIEKLKKSGDSLHPNTVAARERLKQQLEEEKEEQEE